MNNEQFRRLLFDDSTPKQPISKAAQSDGNHGSRSARNPSLGSRTRPSIPMTPRSITSVDFARQLSEHRQDSQPPSKKFKSSAGPKGSRFASGYEDRAALRQREAEPTDDRQKRYKALEEMKKLGQIDEATFQQLCNEIGLGGDITSTHLVKGLDWKLLQKVKAGEDITASEPSGEIDADDQKEFNEDEFEQIVNEREKAEVIGTGAQPKQKKKGNLSTQLSSGATRLTRDEILKQFKASRSARTPSAPTLGNKFKKIGVEPDKKRWIETDASGRRKEILVVTDAEGNVKRKARWLDKPGEGTQQLLSVDKTSKPLGMEIPEDILAKMKDSVPAEDEDDDDIFAGVGDDYNPLADIKDEDDNDSSEDEAEASKSMDQEQGKDATEPDKPGQLDPSSSVQRRDYFAATRTKNNDTTQEQPQPDLHPLGTDPTILQAIKRAAAIKTSDVPSDEVEAGVDKETMLKHKKFLEEARRHERADAMDLDLGFGESRFGDDDDEEGIWPEGEGSSKRKRGPKKRKGDKNNVGDVMRVLEGRKQTGNMEKKKKPGS
ncbi:hypothetical protein FQN57_000549 [Myotisia sp. PD_48]|nr:hypothetical protein FQN57_000549 [Myotisia sp. PD_48]